MLMKLGPVKEPNPKSTKAYGVLNIVNNIYVWAVEFELHSINTWRSL